MKQFLAIFLTIIGLIPISFAQDKSPLSMKNPKGQFFLFWGYNRSLYAKSDIHLKGDDYDFTMYDVPAHDLPEDPSVDGYLNPVNMTIPQFNARGGYFISNKYAITAGWDHTKYRIENYATVKVSGTIESEASEEYAGEYDNDPVVIDHGKFIKIEHSDGLNLLQINLERHDALWVNEQETMGFGSVVGAGIIFPMPWSNSTIFGKTNDDRPHFTGVGASISAGFKFHFLSRFFLQGLAQSGILHMPGIVITPKGGSERASQNIKYLQGMMVLGYRFRIFK